MFAELSRWQTALADRLTVVVISQGSVEENRPVAEEHGIATVLRQESLEVMSAYRVRGTPAALIITADGLVASSAVGSIVAIEPLIRLALRRGATAAVPGPPSGRPMYLSRRRELDEFIERARDLRRQAQLDAAASSCSMPSPPRASPSCCCSTGRRWRGRCCRARDRREPPRVSTG